MTDRGVRPLASAWWWLRCVPDTTSSGRSARTVPTATASWPSEEWMPPGILLARDSRTDSLSNWRMTSICVEPVQKALAADLASKGWGR